MADASQGQRVATAAVSAAPGTAAPGGAGAGAGAEEPSPAPGGAGLRATSTTKVAAVMAMAMAAAVVAAGREPARNRPLPRPLGDRGLSVGEVTSVAHDTDRPCRGPVAATATRSGH